MEFKKLNVSQQESHMNTLQMSRQIYFSYIEIMQLQWRIQDFPGKREGSNLLFGKFFLETAWK